MGVAKNGRMCYILWRKKLNDNGGKKCQNRYHLISVRLTTKKNRHLEASLDCAKFTGWRERKQFCKKSAS